MPRLSWFLCGLLAWGMACSSCSCVSERDDAPAIRGRDYLSQIVRDGALRMVEGLDEYALRLLLPKAAGVKRAAARYRRAGHEDVNEDALRSLLPLASGPRGSDIQHLAVDDGGGAPGGLVMVQEAEGGLVLIPLDQTALTPADHAKEEEEEGGR